MRQPAEIFCTFWKVTDVVSRLVLSVDSGSLDECISFSIMWVSRAETMGCQITHPPFKRILKPVITNDKLQRRAGGDTPAASHGPPERAPRSPDPFTASYVSIFLNPYPSIARSRWSHPSTGSTVTFTRIWRPTSCKVSLLRVEDLGVIFYFLFFSPGSQFQG